MLDDRVGFLLGGKHMVITCTTCRGIYVYMYIYTHATFLSCSHSRTNMQLPSAVPPSLCTISRRTSSQGDVLEACLACYKNNRNVAESMQGCLCLSAARPNLDPGCEAAEQAHRGRQRGTLAPTTVSHCCRHRKAKA